MSSPSSKQPSPDHIKVNPKSLGVLERDHTTALVLSIFLGIFGIDQFYLGKTGKGLLKLFTLGLFGILWLIDVIMIATKSVGGIAWKEEAVSDKAASGNWFKKHKVLTVIIALFVFGIIMAATSNNKTPTTAKSAATTEKSVVPTQSSFLAGNAHPQFPAGPAGQVSVVYQAPISPQQNGTVVPIVLDNNSSKAVAHVDISGTAKDASGKIVGSGDSQGTSPSVIKPGQWALAFIYFQSGDGLSSNDKLSFSVNTSAADTSSYNTAAVQVTQANMSSSGSLTGGVQNTTGHTVTGPISVDAYCFDANGHPTYEQGGFTSGSGDLAANATDSFQIDLSGQQCSSYLVGSSGYYQ